MAHFNPDRKFGVEIETNTRRHASTIANEINRQFTLAGIDNRCEAQSYNHRDQSIWKIVGDASISGWEIVSPPMKGFDGLKQLKAVCKAFDVLEISVDKRCGLHVHHDAADLSGEALGKIGSLYAAFQGTINLLLAPSRRNSWACRPLNWNVFTNDGMDKFKGDTRNSFIQKVGYNRYASVNFQALQAHGTVEFRQHQGSVNATKIWNWVLFTQAIVETGKNLKGLPKVSSNHSDSRRNAFVQLRRICKINAKEKETPLRPSPNDCTPQEAKIYQDAFRYWGARYKHFVNR